MGAEVPVKKNLILVPAISTGVLRIESNADYNGVLADTILKPAFDGLVFNWDADAWLLGASLGVDYQHEFQALVQLNR